MRELIKKDLLNNEYITWYGRYHYDEEKEINYIYNSVSGFMIKTDATSLEINLTSSNFTDESLLSVVQIVIDQDFENTIKYVLREEFNKITINLDGKMHYVELYKQSEAIRNHIGVKSIISNTMLHNLDYKFDHVVEVIGDSTIAGYGNLGIDGEAQNTQNTDGLKDFSFIALKKFNACVHTSSSSGWGIYASIWTTPKTINVDMFKDKVAVLTDIDWDYKKINPSLIIISLGTNDMTYVEEIKEQREQRRQTLINKYVDFVKYKLSQYPTSKLLMTYGIVNDERTYPVIQEIYEILRKSYDNVYKLKLTGNIDGCDGHPSLVAHYQMATELENEIERIMKWEKVVD